MNHNNLKQKTTRGMLWSFIEKISVYGIQFVLGIFVARILMPSDYGLVGMLAIFMSISNVFIDSGFSRALIQKKNRTESDFSTVFIFNLLISIFLYILLYFSAPYIAAFYKEPKLILITRVLSFNFVIQAFTLVQLTKLTIEMDFKSKAIISTFSVLISGVIALLLAYYGWGVWALIAQTLSKTAITLILILILKNWMPKITFSKSSFNALFSYGSKLLIASLLNSIINNLYAILIGKKYSARDVGYFSKGTYFTNILANTASEVLQTVTFPVMSFVQDEKERLTNIYRKLIRFTIFIIIPSMIGFALVAEPFIRFFLTDKWLPAVPIIQWLCIGGIFAPIGVLNINFLNAKGYSGLVLIIQLVKTPIIVGALIITLPMGIEKIVIGQAIASFLCFFVNAYLPGKYSNYGPFKQLKDMLPTLLATGIMVLLILPIITFVEHDLLKIILTIPTGIGSFFLVAYLQKMDEFNELLTLFTNLKKKYFSR